jgi:hypothetical protein
MEILPFQKFMARGENERPNNRKSRAAIAQQSAVVKAAISPVITFSACY